jgi:hypothetical protein
VSKGAWILFHKAYDGERTTMPFVLYLVKLAADDLISIRRKITGLLLSLQYQAPIDEWEEAAFYDVIAAQEELSRAWQVLNVFRTKLQIRVEGRYRAEREREDRLRTARRGLRLVEGSHG